MKKYKFVCLLIVMSVILTSFSGCGIVNRVRKIFTDDKDDPGTGGQVDLPSSCSTVVSDKKNYDLGEEIKITITLQFGVSEFGHLSKNPKGTVRISLVESPYFEIVGDSEISFADVLLNEYFCDDCIKNSSDDRIEKSKSLVADFTIKVSDPTFIPKFVEISALYEVVLPNGATAISTVTNDTMSQDGRMCTIGLRFISDSQGVIVSSTTYKITHRDIFDPESKEFTPVWFLQCDAERFVNDSILQESFNREYLAGVPIEEIMDRYMKRVWDWQNKGIECGLYDHEDNGNTSFDYLSEDLRLRIYISPDDENIKPYIENPSRESLKTILEYALNLGIISEAEYDAEIEKISDESLWVACHNYKRHTYMPIENKYTKFFDKTVFPTPGANDYYEYVVDLTDK